MKSSHNKRARRLGALGVSLLAIGLTAPAQLLACQFEITRVVDRSGPDFSYDVFDNSAQSRATAIEILRVDAGTQPSDSADVAHDSRCTAKISIVAPDAARLSTGPEALQFGLGATVTADIALDQHLLLTAPPLSPGESASVDFYIVIPAGQLLPSGDYPGEVTVSVGQQAGTLERVLVPDDEISHPVSVLVAPATRISFAGVQGNHRTVDFGEIETGGVPIFPPALVVRSTAAYRLRFRSENYGFLVREPISATASIPYKLEVAGETVDLGQVDADVLFDAETQARIPLNFTIIDASDKRAGTYTDRVIVDVMPQLQ